MRKIWLVIKREYVTRAKTKGFVIGTLSVPLIGIAFTFLIAFIAGHQATQSMRLVLVDNAGGIAPAIVRGLDAKLPNGQPQFAIADPIERPASPAAVQDALRAKINSGALDAYLVIPSDFSKPVELHTKNPGNFAVLGPITSAVNQAVVEARLNARGVHVDNIREIVRSADFRVIKVSKGGEALEKGQTIGVAVALVILLYMSLLLYGILTMRSILEEKTTRTMEVLISKVKPSELLAGKILGIAGVAFTQFTIWAASLALLGAFGVAMTAMTGSASALAGIHIPGELLAISLIYFLGGYFLYSSMFAAVGAACSNEQDAGQLQWIATAPLIFTMSIYWVILTDSTSRFSVILTQIPFFSPVLMPLRFSLQPPPIWQLALSIFLLFATTIGVIFASAKVYRIGILMYGKRPTLPEMFRWLRYS
jgi:ABC-2 type transport system permease protein